jgi:internalin A
MFKFSRESSLIDMELRMFRQLLDEVDEHHEWGGLKKVLTPEGHYLWLCEEHAEKYRK